MASRCYTELAGPQFGCAWYRCWLILWLGLAGIPTFAGGCVVNRPGNTYARNDSTPLRVVPMDATSQNWTVRRTSFLGSKSSNLVVANPSGGYFGTGPNLAGPRTPTTRGEPLYAPLPETMVLSEPSNFSVPFVQPTRLNFCDDVRSLPNRFLDEIDALATCENAVFMGATIGLTVYLHDNVDNRVSNQIAQNGPGWNNVSDVLVDFGHAFPFQLPLIGGLYATSLWKQDDDLHELTMTMFTTYKFTLLTSVVLQYATRTHESSNGIFNFFSDSGFPSEQTATTFALAAVIDEACGWKFGLPSYLFASLIGWSEVDQNQHHVSDVVFGAAMGFVIGKSIGALHYRPDAPYKLVPLIDTYYGTQGLGIEFLY
jgi:hypothetical protein